MPHWAVVLIVIVVVVAIAFVVHHWDVERDISRKTERTVDPHERAELQRIQRDIDRGKFGF